MAWMWRSTDQKTGLHTFINEAGDLFDYLDVEVAHLHLNLTGVDDLTLAKVAPDVALLVARAK